MKVRIGIDVGGTFTDAVCVDGETFELIGYVKVPTTHTAKEGVSRGIVEACQKLMDKYGIAPEDVSFIAHGTTQATNALLEGDVEQVGIVCIGDGPNSVKANLDTTIGDLELAPGKYLHTLHEYLDGNSEKYEEDAGKIVEDFRSQGIKVVVAASSFSVDDPSKEQRLSDFVTEKELLATSTHEVSKLYGLRVRTRTAAINASILPKMIETAIMTDTSVKQSGIASPLMIMRCDGGVMDVDEVKKRPVLTMLSGPAAGVAGALMYEKVSDGIFLEVGGTSTDISAIRNGSVMLKYAEVGGHKTYVNSLDVRTVGIAGGSMVRFGSDRVLDAGPRSAHIANLPYAVYADPEEITNPKPFFFSPKEGDPSDYGAIECSNGKKFAITVSCAANYLGYVKEGDYSFGNKESAGKALEAFSAVLGIPAEQIAKQIMDRAASHVIPVVDELISAYGMDAKFTYLVGGGGGSTAIVPCVAEKLAMKHRISKNAEVISPIGVALAMVRDVVERIIINPTQKDMDKLRSEAFDMAVNSGANPSTIEVVFEIEAEKNLIRAIASGTTELRTKERIPQLKTEDEIRAIVAETLELPVSDTEIKVSTGRLFCVGGKTVQSKLFGLLKKEEWSYTLIDDEGVIRLQKRNAVLEKLNYANARNELGRIVSRNSDYEGGEVVPDVFIFFNKQIKPFVGLANKGQVVNLAMLEIDALPEDTELYVLVVKK